MAGRDYGVVMAGRAGRPCDACGKEKARWYCAADEAYLCDRCDVSVHAANALARRHARVPLAPNGAPIKLHRRPRTRPRNSRHTPLPPPSSSPISPSSVLVPSSANITLGNAEDGTKVKKELLVEEECLADGDIDGWCVVPANMDNNNSGGSLASPDMKTEEMSDPDFDLDLDLSHEVPLIYEPLLQELMLMNPDGEDNIMEEILPSNCTPPPYLSPLYLANSHHASLEEEHRHHRHHHHQEDKQEDIQDDYVTEIEDGTISIDNLSSVVGDEFDMLELCEGASSEGLDLHHPGIAAWGNNNHEYGTNIVSSSSSCNPFKGEWDHHNHGLLQADASCHVKIEQDAMLPLGLPMPGVRSWFRTTEKKEEEEEGAVGRMISLKLDYEEVLSAWSDRGSLWMDGQRPQIVPDLDMASLEARIMAESSRGGCFDQLNQVPVIERVIGEAREARVLRYREKRRSRHFSKKIRYEVRKLNAEKRPRLKGRFVRRSELEEASETT